MSNPFPLLDVVITVPAIFPLTKGVKKGKRVTGKDNERQAFKFFPRSNLKKCFSPKARIA